LGVANADTGVFSISDRDRILDAMAACCADNGYEEITTETVIDRAGVAPESFHSLFADKEDCALAALNKLVSETLAQISMTSTRAEGIEQRKFEVKAILELMAAQPSFAWLGFVVARQGGTARMHDSWESAAGVLALVMARLGEGAGRPGASARASLGGAEAVVRRELAAGRVATLSQLLPDFVYAALVPFVGQREALRQSKLAARLAAEEE
jgi:AcrR family transcriptional regulator